MHGRTEGILAAIGGAAMRQDFVKAITTAIEQNRINKLHTIVPGKIVDYDLEQGTATIQPLASTHFNGENVPYPLLYEVPVVFPKFGLIEISGPVEENDEVLLVFSERNLDEWREAEETTSPSQYSMQNAIAIPGFLYGVHDNTAQAQEDKSLIIKNDTVQIEVHPDKLRIVGDIVIKGTVSYEE